MKITITKGLGEANDPRATMIECIAVKICNLDLETLRKVYEATAKVMDGLRKPFDEQG